MMAVHRCRLWQVLALRFNGGFLVGAAASLQVRSSMHIGICTIKGSTWATLVGQRGSTLAIKLAAHSMPAAAVCAFAAALLACPAGTRHCEAASIRHDQSTTLSLPAMSCRHEAGCLAGTEGWQGLRGFSLEGSSNAAMASQHELQGQLDIQVETLQGKCH